MRLPNLPWFKELMELRDPPCVSIYMPLVRANPPAAENGRLYRELIDKARAELISGYPSRDVEPLIQSMIGATEAPGFWTGPRDAIAIFASPGYLRVIDLQTKIDARVDVADTFHVRPLIRLMQADRRYHVLAVTLKHVDLYEGSQYGLRRLEAEQVPQDPLVVSKMRVSHQIDAAADIKSSNAQYQQEGQSPGAVSEDRFLRAVDKAVWEQFSRDAKLPMILVADENRNKAFRGVTKNNYLLERGLTLDPNGVDLERLHRETWALLEPRFQAEAQEMANRFKAARARQLGSDDLQPVVAAAAIGRVDTLLIDADRHIPGRIEDAGDGGTFQFKPSNADDPRVDDVLDDLAEMVLKTDGAVMILPPNLMPTDSGVAAIYRY